MMVPAVKSCVSSFVITTLMTKNYVAGIQAALMAAVATAIYQIANNFFKGSYPTETFVFSGLVTTLIGTTAGISLSPLSIVASAIPLALKYPVNEIPIFAIIVV
jgi:hypothetical protein